MVLARSLPYATSHRLLRKSLRLDHAVLRPNLLVLILSVRHHGDIRRRLCAGNFRR